VKIKHILKTKDFRTLIVNGKKLPGRAVLLYVQETKKNGVFPLKVGVTTSKKQAARAVKRNYVKRLIYAELRKVKVCEDISLGLIVRLIKPVNKMTRKEIACEIQQDLKVLCGRIDGIL